MLGVVSLCQVCPLCHHVPPPPKPSPHLTETHRHKRHSLPGVRHSPLLRRQLQLPASMHSGPVPGAES